jgi:hypothetical protein
VVAGLLSLSALLLAPTIAAAQEEKGNFAVSYSLLHDFELEETFPVGWLVALTGHFTPNFAFVGEVGGSYKTIDFDGDDVSFRVYSFLGGVKFQSREASFTPFAQALLGAAVAGVSFAGESESTTAFAVQPGAGIDFRLNDSLSMRLQGDYRFITSEGESSNEFRFAVGIVFPFGR